jgi:hypothetical protein
MADFIHSMDDMEQLKTETMLAARFAAHEASIFMNGNIIPVAFTESNSQFLRVPVIGKFAQGGIQEEAYDGTTLTGWGAAGAQEMDLEANELQATDVVVRANLIANRAFIRDYAQLQNGIVASELGRSVAANFDAKVAAKFDDITASVSATSTLTSSDVLKAATTVRSAAITDNLVAVLHPSVAAGLLEEVKVAAFAGSAAQDASLRNGFVGSIHGVDIYQTTYAPKAGSVYTGCVMSREAFMIAKQYDLATEIDRRTTAVGFDIVSHLHAGVEVIRNDYAVKLLAEGIV